MMVRRFILQKLNWGILVDLVRVGQSQLGPVVAKLLWGGDAQLVQGWLQLLKIQSQSLNCPPLHFLNHRGNGRYRM